MLYEAQNLNTLACFEHKIMKLKDVWPMFVYSRKKETAQRNRIEGIRKSIQDQGLRFPLLVVKLDRPYAKVLKYPNEEIYAEKKLKSVSEHDGKSAEMKRAAELYHRRQGEIEYNNFKYVVFCGCQRVSVLWDVGCTEVSCRIIPVKHVEKYEAWKTFEHCSKGITEGWSLGKSIEQFKERSPAVCDPLVKQYYEEGNQS